MKTVREKDRGIYCNSCRERIYNVKNINHQLSDRDWRICTTCAPIKKEVPYYGF